MHYVLTVMALLPFCSFAQTDIFSFLRSKVSLNQPLDSIQCKYFKNVTDQGNLRILFSTKYRFYPDSTDTIRSFNFNVDSMGRVCSIVVVSPIDSNYFGRIFAFLGVPSMEARYGGGFVSKWDTNTYRVAAVTFDGREFLIIYRKNGKAEDFFKFKFDKSDD